MGIEISGCEALAAELSRLSAVRFDAVCEKSVAQMLQRGKSEGGTPVDTGELRQSMSMRAAGAKSEVGYAKSYAPHVEYGHRQNVGQFVPKLGKRLVAPYVAGQLFLKANVGAQRPIFINDLIKQLRGL